MEYCREVGDEEKLYTQIKPTGCQEGWGGVENGDNKKKPIYPSPSTTCKKKLGDQAEGLKGGHAYTINEHQKKQLKKAAVSLGGMEKKNL